MNNKIKKGQRGFTVIELLVVTAIFLLVMGVSVVIFISVVLNQKKILSEQRFLNQISYAKEHMSKALRMAVKETDEECLIDDDENYQPGFIYLLTNYDSSALAGYKGIKFLNQSDENENGVPACQEFIFEKDDESCQDQPDERCPRVIKEIKNGVENNLTSPELKITDVKFIVNGVDDQETCVNPCGAKECGGAVCPQPKVTIMIETSLPGDDTLKRIFQTTVSQRNLNAE